LSDALHIIKYTQAERHKNQEKAIDHCEKSLDFWKDADPGIAEVEDAWKRLAGLKERSLALFASYFSRHHF
jgi:hypothetical protein